MNDIIEMASFPQGWDVLKMRQCFSFGKGLSITKEDLVEEGVPVISYGQVHAKDNTGTGLSEELYRYVPESFLKTGKSCLVRKNDFIFADTSEDYAGVGNCAFIDNDKTIFAGYHSIIARPTSSALYPKYLAYLFLTDLWRDQIRANVMGIKVFSITQQLLRDTYICIPPVSEQKRIVELLDESCSKLDKIIANLERQIGLLQKYKKSLITETVTKGLDKNVEIKDSGISWPGKIPKHWNIKRLKYICSYITDGSHFSPDTVDEGYPYITAADVHGEGLDYENAKKISEFDFKQLQRAGCRPKKDDVLLVKDGATTGRVGFMTDNAECVVLSSVAILRGNNRLNNKFLMYLMESEFMQSQIEVSMAGSAMPRTILAKIMNYYGILCPIEEQNEIVSFLDQQCLKIDKILRGKETQLERIQSFKYSEIYEYVTGKKRVKEVV